MSSASHDEMDDREERTSEGSPPESMHNYGSATMASGLGHAAHDGPSGSDGTMTTFIRALHPQVRAALQLPCRQGISLLHAGLMALALADDALRFAPGVSSSR